MVNNINLLPVDLGSQSQLGKLSAILSKTGLIIGVGILILGAMLGTYMLLLTKNISDSRVRGAELVASISANENVEQQFVLVRDRIDKIKPVLSGSSASDTAVVFEALTNSIPLNIVISQAKIQEGVMEVTFQTTRSTDLLGLFNAVSASDTFQSVSMKNFSFNPAVGYIATIELTTK